MFLFLLCGVLLQILLLLQDRNGWNRSMIWYCIHVKSRLVINVFLEQFRFLGVPVLGDMCLSAR